MTPAAQVHGTTGRQILAGWKDVYSGKLLALRLGRTESTELVGEAFADVLRDRGVPEHVLIDNGLAGVEVTK